MWKTLIFYSFAISMVSCKKNELSVNYEGTYRGQIEKTTWQAGSAIIEPYNMTVEIVRDTSMKMKLIFEGLSFSGVFTSENKFKLNTSVYPSGIVYGTGEFDRSHLKINYSHRKINDTEIIYSGVLDKD